MNNVNLKEFSIRFPLRGEWQISYYDRSHLPKNKMVELGNLVIEDMPEKTVQDVIPFTFTVGSEDQITQSFKACWKDDDEQLKKLEKIPPNIYTEIIYGELAESLIRTRIARPEIDHRDWQYLLTRQNLILVTDTNMIKRGVISYLSDVFEHKPIWAIIPVVSMLELQTAAGKVKFSSNAEPKKYNPYLSKRAMSTSSTRELRILQDRGIPVEFLEMSPELLSSNVLPDRKIIECVKRVVKDKSIAAQICFLSGDADMVRFAKLENIHAIYVDKKRIEGNEQFYSTRYDIFKGGFVACGVHEFLWDLAHIFSFIKANNLAENRSITLDYYFSGKNLRDWEQDILQVREHNDESISS